jgi:large subunit ribosomal protein L25
MKSIELKAFPRTRTRRKGARKVRAAGRIPAVIYGRTTTARSLEVDSREFDLLLHGAHSEIILVDLAVEGETGPRSLALVQDVQHHPLSGKVLHVDFHEVKEDEKVTVQVPVESSGEAVGVRVDGGVLEHVLFKLKVRALPKDLPDQILVDVSELAAGKTIHLGEIISPEGVEILGNKEISVFAVATPLVPIATPADAAAAAPAKGKKGGKK